MKKHYSLLLAGALALFGAGTADAAKTVPYSSPITVSSTEFDDGWTQIDANNDADGTRGIWGPSSRSGYSNPNSNGSAARYYSFSGDAPADDYLVSPAITLEAGTEYMIRYGIATESTSYPKNVYLFAATTASPEAFKANDPLQFLPEYKDNYFKIQNVTFTPTQDGDFYFAIYTDSPNKNYYLFASTFAVYKNEFAPEGVSNLKAERDDDRTQVRVNLSWTLPTQSVFGEEFTEDQTVEKVNIYRDGAPRAIASLTGAVTEFEDNTEYGLEAGIHTYEVEVVVDGKVSPKVSATTKYVGPVTPATLPYTWACSDADAFDDWTVFNGQGAVNTRVWTLYAYGTPRYAQFICEKDKAEDNYLVAPPFAIPEAGYYKVTYTGNPSNNSYTSNVELRYGTAPTEAAMTNVVTDRIEFTSNNKDVYSYVCKIDEPGTYYFAAVATNPKPDFGINVYCYSIGVEATEKTPAKVTDLVANAGANDALEVILSWTAPTTSTNGEPLATSEYKTEIYKAGQLLATLDGGVNTYTDTAIEQPGVFNYSVKTVATGAGASAGEVAVTSKWVGPHLVALPYSTTFKPDDTTVAIWDIVDANNDGKTWHYYSNSYRCTQSDVEGAEEGTRQYNDYFLTPHFELTPGYYAVTFTPLGGNASKPMTHNVGFVKAGTFEAGVSVLEQPQQYTSSTVSTYSAKTETYLFKVEEAGRYQVVFAAIGDQPVVTSTSDSYSFYGFANFTADAYPVLPAVATDLAVVAAEDEVLEATLTWVNPTTTNVEGLDLDAIAKAVIIRDGEEVAEVTEGLVPGENASFTDSKATGLTGGPHTYAVEIYNASGKSKDAAPQVKLDWVGGGLDITEEGVQHTYAEFEAYYTFIDVHGNQKSSYDGWSISGTTAMKVDETNSNNEYDDWAISPRFNIKDGGIYELTFETYIGASYRDYAPYSFDVYVGQGDDTEAYTKIGTVTTVNPSSTASNFETNTITITGAELAALAEGDEAEAVTVPAGSLAFAFRATQKGGVFVKTFTAKKLYEPAEEEPALPEDAYVVYNDGSVNSELHTYGWWAAGINYDATAPDNTEHVFEFKADNGGAAASMGINMEAPQNTGILHDATLNFTWYTEKESKYTVRLTSVAEQDYTFTTTADQVGQWNTTSLSVAEVFPTVAAQWNANTNLGVGYVFSIILDGGVEGDAIYFKNIYYTNVDNEWEAPEVVIPAPETVPVPEQDADDVFSFFSAYGNNVAYGVGGWGQSTQVNYTEVEGQNIMSLRNFNYLGLDNFNINVSDYDYMHVDYWTPSEGTPFGFVPISLEPTVDTPIWNAPEVKAGEWNSYDAPLSEFGADMSAIRQLKFVANQNNGTTEFAYIANIYFWKDNSEEPDQPGDENGEYEGAIEGVYEQTLEGETKQYAYTFNYNIVYNEDETLTVDGKFTWADGAPVGTVDHKYFTVTDNGGEKQVFDGESLTTDATYTKGQEITIHVKLPVANGAVEFDINYTVGTSGINDVEADAAENARFFNLQGVEVAHPAAGNVYIKVVGNTVTKVLVK